MFGIIVILSLVVSVFALVTNQLDRAIYHILVAILFNQLDKGETK